MTVMRAFLQAFSLLLLAAAVLVPAHTAAAADNAKGSLTYKGSKKTFALTLKHAYLVKGPDTFDEKKTVRRLVLTADDFSAAINGTDALSGFDGSLNEGMIVDLVDGPRLNYWVVFNNQLVQYSGTVEPSALKAGTDKPDHVKGKLTFDDSAAGGAKVDVEFDAPLLKAFTKAR
jgi:hypothetical protein